MIRSRKGELVSEACARLIYIYVDSKPVSDEQAVLVLFVVAGFVVRITTLFSSPADF